MDICYAPVSARRRSWRRPLSLPCHYQEIIRTISPLIRLFAANGQLLAQTYEHLDCDIPLNKYPIRLGRRSKRGKVICPGSQHVDLTGLELTTFRLWVLRCSARPHVPSRTSCGRFKGLYADHILIPQGSTRSSTFFDIKWKPIFFYLQIQNFSFKFFIVLEI